MPVAVLLGETAAGRPTVPRLVPAAAAACLPFHAKQSGVPSTPRASAPEPSHAEREAGAPTAPGDSPAAPTASTQRAPKYASELQEERVAALPAFLEQQWLRTDVPGVSQLDQQRRQTRDD